MTPTRWPVSKSFNTLEDVSSAFPWSSTLDATSDEPPSELSRISVKAVTNYGRKVPRADAAPPRASSSSEINGEVVIASVASRHRRRKLSPTGACSFEAGEIGPYTGLYLRASACSPRCQSDQVAILGSIDVELHVKDILNAEFERMNVEPDSQ